MLVQMIRYNVIMKNVIFFSGTHGVGKTTTIKEISKNLKLNIFNEIADDHRNPCEKDVFLRQAWRIGKYGSDVAHLIDLRNHSKEIILADRCAYDWLAYTRTFYKYNWLTKSEFERLENYFNSLFNESFLPKNVIWFNPPFEWSKERILNRWNEEKKKWNEGDFEYLRVLREEFGGVYNSAKGLNLLQVRSIDITERVSEVESFINSVSA